MDQTAAGLTKASVPRETIGMSAQDRAILRELAARVAALAARPEEAVKRGLWLRHNRLEETRPLIFCDPENGWNEIIPDAALACEGALARSWEMRLRKEIFWGESMGDDRVVDGAFPLAHVFQESNWGMSERRIGGQDGGAYVWDAPLKSYDDMARLHFPRIEVDAAGTERLLDLARQTLGDLLHVRLRTQWWWSLGMTWILVNLRGLEQVMLDTYDHPTELCRLMAFLRDGTLAKLDFLEKNRLLSLNNDAAYVGSGGFGFTDELPRRDFNGVDVRAVDLWGFCESQETITFSPAMFDEFIFPYQLPILQRFGLNCYGCCEPLDKRWDVVRRAPNLRRVSVSAWCDLDRMAALLGNRYLLSFKPHPSDLALPRMDEDRVRRGLQAAILAARGCRLEIIMKDNHTIGRNPQNVTRWCRIAREEADRA